MKLFCVFRKNDVVQSHSFSQLQQAFNKCKSIFLVSKIYPAVYVAFAHHVPRFSKVNSAARQFCELSLPSSYANLDEESNDKLSLLKSGIFTSI